MSNVENVVEQPTMQPIKQPMQPPLSRIIRIDQRKLDIDTLICDRRKCPQIWDYPINQQDEICRAYIMLRPYQFVMYEYPLSRLESHPIDFKLVSLKVFLG